jgi:hypothetical protein
MISTTYGEEESPLFQNSYKGISPGARPQSMGGAFVAVADDANTIFWNPAGLTKITDKVTTLSYEALREPNEEAKKASHQIWGKGMNFLGVAFPNHGICWRRVANFYKRGGSIEFRIDEFIFSTAEKGEILSSGINIKYLNGRISEAKEGPSLITDHGHGIGFDFGMLYSLNDSLSIGAIIHNVWAKMYWEEYSPDKLTPIIRFGAAMMIKKFLTLAFDLEREWRGAKPTMHFGIEIKPFFYMRDETLKTFVLRGGSFWEKGEDKTYSAGVGFLFGKLQVDFELSGENLEKIARRDFDIYFTLSISKIIKM